MISKFFLFHIKHYKTIVYICYTLNAQTVWHEVGTKFLGCLLLAVRAHLNPPLFDDQKRHCRPPASHFFTLQNRPVKDQGLQDIASLLRFQTSGFPCDFRQRPCPVFSPQ